MPNIDLSQMNDDDAAQLSGATPAQPQAQPSGSIDLSTLTDADAAKLHTPPPQQSEPIRMTDVGRAAEQGLTFGFGDELNAYLRSKGLWAGAGSGEDYEKALADERARMANFQEQHPVAAAASEIAGSLPTAFAPALQGINGMRYLSEAKTAGQAVRRAMGVGGGYGTISGFGHGEGDFANRAENAAVTGAESAALSGPFGYLGYKAGAAKGGIDAARAESGANGDVSAAALNDLGKAFSRDDIDPVADIIHGQMLPMNRTALTPEEMQQAITASRQTGEDYATIAARYASQKSKSGNVNPGTIGNIVRDFGDNTTTPMTLTDRAKMVRPGSGANTEWRMRAAAASPGEARREAMENLTNNQLGQYSRLMDATDKYVGNGSDDIIAAAQQKLKDSENAIYKAARDTQKPYDLGPVLDKWNNEIKMVSPSSPIGQKLKEAINNFYDERAVANPMGTNYMKEYTPIQGLERFQGAKENLDDMIEASMENGRGTHLTTYLQGLKSDIMGEIANTNNVWKEANDTFTGAGRQALKAGGDLSLRLGSKSRELEKQFARYEKQAADPNPAIAAAGQAQIDLFRQGFSRSLQDGLQNKGQTNDLARTLVTPAAQKIMTRILGKDQADAFNNILRQEQTTTSTFNKIRGGSQTTPLREEIDESKLPALISGASDVFFHPMKVLTDLGLRAAGKIYSARNAELMKHMSNLDPVEQMNTLRSINTVKQAREFSGGQGARAVLPFAESGVGSQSEHSLRGGIGPRYDDNANLREGQEEDTMKKRRGFAEGGIADTDDEDTGGIMPYLEGNPHGWMDKPVVPPYQGEIRNIPEDDYGGLPGPSAPASLAYDLSGIPTALEGIRTARQGSDEGRPGKMLSGMGETALSAAPIAATRMPAATARMSAKALGGLGATALGASVGSDLVEAGNRKSGYVDSAKNAGQRSQQGDGSEAYAELRKQAGDDPKALALLSQLMQLDHKSGAKVEGVSSESSQMVRDQASRDATTVRNQLIDRIAEMNAAHEPFDKAYPTTSRVLPWIGSLGPMVLGAGYGAWSKMPPGGWQRALNTAEREFGAMSDGSPVSTILGQRPANAFKGNLGLNKAINYQEAYNNPGLVKSAMHEAAPVAMGAGVGYESRALPHQYNQRNAPTDSQAKKDADAYLSDPSQSAMPAIWGGLGAWTGKHFGSAFGPGAENQNAATNALRDMAQGKGMNFNPGPPIPLREIGPELPPPSGGSRGLGGPQIGDGGGLGSGPPSLPGPSRPQSLQGAVPEASPSGEKGLGQMPPPSSAAASPEAEVASKRIGGMGEAVKQNAGPDMPVPANTNTEGYRFEPGGSSHHIHFQKRNKKGRVVGPPTQVLDTPPGKKSDGTDNE